jgi:hypothetical protein
MFVDLYFSALKFSPSPHLWLAKCLLPPIHMKPLRTHKIKVSVPEEI